MSLKVKLTSTICAFILILGLMVMGVFASSTATVNLGGSLSFSANNVHARVAGEVSGAENARDVNLPELTFMEGRSADEQESHEDDVEAWGEAGLQFNSDGDSIVIVLTIENLASDRPLYATVKTSTNMSNAVNSEMLIVESPTAETGTVYASAPIKLQQQDTSNTEDIVYLRLTISLKDKNTSLPADAKWGYDIELENECPAQDASTYSNLSFSYLDQTAKTLSVSKKNSPSGAVEIPSYVIFNDEICVVTSIGEVAFWGCSGLTSIAIPDSVTSIGNSAFRDCRGLTSIEIPDSVTSIGGRTFELCTKLTGIEIPDSVTSIENGAFYGCLGLESVTIGSGVTSIGSSVFDSCSGLASITIPNSVESIGGSAFYGCSSLKRVIIDSATIASGITASDSCGRLIANALAVYVNESLYDGDFVIGSYLSNQNNYLQESTETINGKTYKLYMNPIESEVFDKVKYTYDYANQTATASMVDTATTTGVITILGEITNSADGKIYAVTSIPGAAFRRCSGITSVIIESGVTSIGIQAFDECSGLKNISIPEGVTSIEGSAFMMTGLTEISLPASLERIGNSAFTWCNSLKTLEVKATNPPTLNGALPTTITKIYVPTGSKSAYTGADYWKNFDASVFEEKDF